MHGLFRQDDPALLVSPEFSDDAGVYRVGANLALVETADVITPVVDDPAAFGRIAAANALSDVYAMGGTPVTAMNLVFFPACDLPGEVLKEILAGGVATLREAGVCLVGGHTVEDGELKYGMAVTGLIDPERIIRNSTACVGDQLFLTKPLGTGIVSTAIKADMADPDVIRAAMESMIRLNRDSSGLMREVNASAATDVTGFGLIGHACEMARGAGVTFRILERHVPILPGVRDLVQDGLVPAGCYRNRDYYGRFVSTSVTGDHLLPLYDPQTSGGLLIALPPKVVEVFSLEAKRREIGVVCVGEVIEAGARSVEIL